MKKDSWQNEIIGHRSNLQGSEILKFACTFFRARKSMFVCTSCTVVFYSCLNCVHVRVYGRNYEYTQVTLLTEHISWVFTFLLKNVTQFFSFKPIMHIKVFCRDTNNSFTCY